MNIALQRDIGSLLASALALPGQVITAGAGNDGVEQNGNVIDHSPYLSGKLIIAYSAVLAQAATLTIAANLQDASDSTPTDPLDFGTAFASQVVATGGTGGSTEVGTVEIDVNLSSARGFLRAQITADLSAGSIDTVALAAVFVLGGRAQN